MMCYTIGRMIEAVIAGSCFGAVLMVGFIYLVTLLAWRRK